MRPRLLLLVVTVAAAALIAASFAPRPVRGYEHITNGGFEDGASGWGTDAETAFSVTAAAAFGGSAGAHLIGAGALRLSYVIDGALAEGRYVLSARVRPLDDDAEVSLRLTPDGWGAMQSSSLATSGAWTEVSATFDVASASGASIRVSIDGGEAYIDDVRLDGAPPVTLTPTPTITSVPPAGGELTPVVSGTPMASPTATPTPFVDVIAAHVRNPGFEESTVDGLPLAWEKYGGVLNSDSGGRSGQAARLESTTESTKWLHQAVTVDGGAWYAFGAWIQHDDLDVAAAFLRVSWYASGDASGEALSTADSAERLTSASSGYRHLSTAGIQAPTSARSARMRIMLVPRGAASAAITVDDVSWETAQPAPASPTATARSTVVDGGDMAANGATGERAVASRRSSARSTQSAVRPFTGTPSDARIVINEVLYDADGEAADGELEWIELYNASDDAVDIAGWSLLDGVSGDVLPPLVVPARGFAIVAATDAFFDAYREFTGDIAVLEARLGNGLGNDGDALFLLDPSGRAIDAVSWGDNAFALRPAVGDVPEGHSIERDVAGRDRDTADDWIDNEFPSPGMAYMSGRDGGGTPDQASTIDMIEGSGSPSWDWLPWALVAGSSAALAATLGWRALEMARSRLRQQS